MVTYCTISGFLPAGYCLGPVPQTILHARSHSRFLFGSHASMKPGRTGSFNVRPPSHPGKMRGGMTFQLSWTTCWVADHALIPILWNHLLIPGAPVPKIWLLHREVTDSPFCYPNCQKLILMRPHCMCWSQLCTTNSLAPIETMLELNRNAGWVLCLCIVSNESPKWQLLLQHVTCCFDRFEILDCIRSKRRRRKHTMLVIIHRETAAYVQICHWDSLIKLKF